MKKLILVVTFAVTFAATAFSPAYAQAGTFPNLAAVPGPVQPFGCVPAPTPTLGSPYICNTTFFVTLIAENGDITLGLPTSNLPFVTVESMTVYKNGVPDRAKRFIAVSYSQPSFGVRPGAGASTFVLRRGDSVTIQVAVSFGVQDAAAVYGISLDALYWSTADGKSMTQLGGARWYAGQVPLATSSPATGAIEWSLDWQSHMRSPLLSNRISQEIATYNGVVTGDSPASLSSVDLAIRGLSNVYLVINGVTYFRTDRSTVTAHFETVPLSFKPGTAITAVIRGDVVPEADYAQAVMTGFGGIGRFATPAATPAKKPIVDIVPAEGITNLSSRVYINPGQVVTVGLNVASDAAHPRQYLIRAVGPGLRAFGVANATADTQLALYSGPNKIAEYSGWTSETTAASSVAGAFPLQPGNKDSAIYLPLFPGSYTIQVRSSGATAGEVLLEVYELPDSFPKG